MGTPGTSGTISWDEGELNFTIPGSGQLSLWASPGNYTFNYTIPMPDNFVVDSSTLRGITLSTVVANMTNTVSLLRVSDVAEQVNISTTHAADITFSWSTGSETLNLDPGTMVSIWLAMGYYDVSYSVYIPGEWIVGGNMYTVNFNMTAQPRTSENIILPAADAILGFVEIIGLPGSSLNFT